MPDHSAGILLHRASNGRPEVLLVHPGGPFWARKDDGAWSIPKGLFEPGSEDPLEAARREFAEEAGHVAPSAGVCDLGTVRQPSGKIVHAFAIEGDLDVSTLHSNLFEMEWPPRSGARAEFPEVDRGGWFDLEAARRKLQAGQVPFLDRFGELSGAGAVVPASRGPLTRREDLAHPWCVSLDEAARIQDHLAPLARIQPLSVTGPCSPRVAAGVDIGYSKDGTQAWAAAVAMDRAFRIISSVVVEGRPDLPYAPGFLAFREGRLSIEALTALDVRPDLVFVDGHGVVHERGFGLASHLGVLLDVPTIGVPKTPFHAIDHLPGPRRGDYYVLTKEWGAQGASVRLKAGVKPVYVSPGHLVDLESAIALALEWASGRHRVPEPLAAAHTLSTRARNGDAEAVSTRRA